MGLRQVFMTNMKKYRKEKGFTQEKLAELCATDPAYIGQLENGRRCPSMVYIEKISTALNIAPYLLFYDETDPALGRGRLEAMQKEAFTKGLIADINSRICSFVKEYL
jgi:transcriptional regulator with XRE-family HTH domain